MICEQQFKRDEAGWFWAVGLGSLGWVVSKDREQLHWLRLCGECWNKGGVRLVFALWVYEVEICIGGFA